MKIIETGITGDLEERPQLKIMDKSYTVDNRQRTWEKIQEIQKNPELIEKEKTRQIYELALGKEQAEEILNLDLSVEKTVYLSFCIMGAITGQDPKELQKVAREQIGKNL